jgi:hypothetical protein
MRAKSHHASPPVKVWVAPWQNATHCDTSQRLSVLSALGPAAHDTAPVKPVVSQRVHAGVVSLASGQTTAPMSQ